MLAAGASDFAGASVTPPSWSERPHISAFIGSAKLARWLAARLLKLSLPLTLLTELRGVLADGAIALPPDLYRLSTLAACDDSFFPAILANGQPSLLGVPSMVKSCSSGDSEIEGIIQLPVVAGSAEGPDQILTPSGPAATGLGRPARRRWEAHRAEFMTLAASFDD